MKRRDLIKRLEKKGCVLVRHGGNHDWYSNPKTKQSQPIPRHNEVNENLAKSIIRKLSEK
ncbi:MAG: type II toxin-antitoxin system HicA family toxin [Pyrinomonadaceae bacterium]|nr:type II toxin-antitoxin system HicA family toxin [Pyrinomonadaceae bacterium]